MMRVVKIWFCLLPITGMLWAQGDRRGTFTQPNRSVRSRDVDQRHIRLELQFDFEKQILNGRAVLDLLPFRPLKRVSLDAAEMRVRRVRLAASTAAGEAVVLEHEFQGQELVVTLNREYARSEPFRLEVDYQVREPRHGAHFVVPDVSEPDQPRMVWTQSEPEYARYWFPCIDSPVDRLTSEIIATVPSSFQVLSNGSLKQQIDNQDGTHTWHWSQAKSHVPYLMSVVAGDFEVYEQEWDGIPIRSYVPRGRLADAARSFQKTPEMMAYFSERIGLRYPWPKYAQICVDEYMWGGMEHTSATTLTSRTLHDGRADLDTSSHPLVAHELVHQWFGDLLTCKDWGELWLNESFATYFTTLWQEHDQGWDEATWTRHRDGESYKAEDRRYRRSIVNYQYREPGAMFDRHSYPKGGRVLHMLRFVLGDELFWESIRRYAAVNQHRTVETADLRIAVEDATGQGLNWFFDQWVHHGGHPEFSVNWSWDEATKTVTVTVKQTQKTDDLTARFRMPVEIELASHSASQIRRVNVSKAEETFHFQLDKKPTRVCFDPRDWVLKKLTVVKSREEWLDQLAYSDHVMPRARAAEKLSAFKADPEVIEALVAAAGNDPFWAVREQAVKTLGGANGAQVRQTLLAISRDDQKSNVRRQAIAALKNFKHEETIATLRQTIADDRSYFAVAAALRSLVALDREQVADDLFQALQQDSYRNLILRAAVDGLINIKAESAETTLRSTLEESLTPDRRVAVIAALARLHPEDPELLRQLYDQLGNDRRSVRRAAINAIVKIGDPAAIDVLLRYRDREETAGALRAYDDAISNLREKQKGFNALRKETTALRKRNRELEERLKKLEEKLGDE